ncbi:MAG: hypothetical protein IPJ85_17240 [Flavobacteriales bacterium]|nr:hypothetical protein [Flavobacteriales bacterium]
MREPYSKLNWPFPARGESIELAAYSSKASKEARNAKAAEVKVALTTVADYVRMVAKGVAAILSTSGFELAKQRAPIGVPGITKLLQARMTNKKGMPRAPLEPGVRRARLPGVDDGQRPQHRGQLAGHRVHHARQPPGHGSGKL